MSFSMNFGFGYPGYPYGGQRSNFGQQGQRAAESFLQNQRFPIRYTNQSGNTQDPNRSPYYDAIGYSEVMIEAYDHNGDRRLNLNEIAEIFADSDMDATGRTEGRQFLQSTDVNRDGQVDVLEHTGMVLFQDALDDRTDGRITEAGIDAFNAYVLDGDASDRAFVRSQIGHFLSDDFTEAKKPRYGNLQRTLSEIYEDYQDGTVYRPGGRPVPGHGGGYPPKPGGGSGGYGQMFQLMQRMLEMMQRFFRF